MAITNLLPSCSRLVINQPISECVRMAGNSLLTTGLLQVVNGLGASYNKSATDKQQIYRNLMTQAGKIDNLQQVYVVFGSMCVCGLI